MFCPHCGTQAPPTSDVCTNCGSKTAGGHGQPPTPVPMSADGIPAGVKGWSWGAFLLNWIWAIGNRTWIGLLSIIPLVGWIVAIWLGFKGREMAWKNKQWKDLDHFNRVQRKWTWWGVGIASISILAHLAVAVPAYLDYVAKAQAARSSVQQDEVL